MWFKNLTLFRLVQPFSLTAEALAALLGQRPFQPCPSFQASVAGWVPPLGRKTQDRVHTVFGRWLVCLRTEEKLLPPVVVNQALAERIALIEDEQRRPVRRRERLELRERLVQELLPRALVRSRLHYAYFDLPGGWLVVDGATPRVVDAVTGVLRDTLGSLPIAPIQVRQPVAATMTAWLYEGQVPSEFALGDSCELREGRDERSVVRCRGQDLTSEEIRAHLTAGKQVTQLSLNWHERLTFILDESLTLRRIQFLDTVRASLREEALDSPEAVRDAEFALMIGELERLLPRLLELFGGVVS